MAYEVTPLGGIDFSLTYTVSTSTPEYPGTPFLPGTTVQGNSGKYCFIKASTAIAVNNAVGITQTTSSTDGTILYSGAPLTKTLADASAALAVAPVAIALNDYGWVKMDGPVTITLKNACLPSVPLYTTATAGFLDDTSASQTRIYGIRSQKTATASGAAKLAWISNLTV